MWVRGVYKAWEGFVFLSDQKKCPRGTAMPSVVFLVTREAKPLLPARGNFLWGEALHR